MTTLQTHHDIDIDIDIETEKATRKKIRLVGMGIGFVVGFAVGFSWLGLPFPEGRSVADHLVGAIILSSSIGFFFVLLSYLLAEVCEEPIEQSTGIRQMGKKLKVYSQSYSWQSKNPRTAQQ